MLRNNVIKFEENSIIIIEQNQKEKSLQLILKIINESKTKSLSKILKKIVRNRKVLKALYNDIGEDLINEGKIQSYGKKGFLRRMNYLPKQQIKDNLIENIQENLKAENLSLNQKILLIILNNSHLLHKYFSKSERQEIKILTKKFEVEKQMEDYIKSFQITDKIIKEIIIAITSSHHG